MRRILLQWIAFLMLWRGVEPRPISVMEDIKNTFSSLMKNQDESLAKDVDAQKQYSSHLDNVDGRFADVFDDILSQVSNEPSETSFEEVKPTDLSSLVENMKEDTPQSKVLTSSEFTSGSIMDNNIVVKLVDELIEYTLFKNPLEILLAEEATMRGKSLIEIDKGDHSEDTPWIQLTTIVCQNIIVWITVMGATLTIMMMLLFLLNTYIRRWQPLYPAAHEKYDVFMTGQA